jgi:hypothetical protein
MIARAAELSSSPESSPSVSLERSTLVSSSPVASSSPSPSPSPKAPVFKFFRGPCYDPVFPGHAPCATHDHDPPFACYVDDALEVFLDRFEVEHFSTTTADYFRGWQDAKYTSGNNMVPGSSKLRQVMSVEGDEQTPEVAENFEVYVDEIDGAVRTSKKDILDIANILQQPPSSPLPAISYTEMDEALILKSRSSLEVDVSGMAAHTSEEPAASGFGSDNDNVSVVSLETDSPVISSMSLHTPPGQVVFEDEVLGV